eukprot:TRINITY_DN10462_c0_g1_i1.p1 TRINITY_DN10462_c0_g1~~TRINITY_DN10462_c0_g1_i1.p1  ORF type:complete len:168 (-),score=37.57 TRINITY_DN10462_c0_g1_i1:177-680(-)
MVATRTSLLVLVSLFVALPLVCHGYLDYIVNKQAFDKGLYRALSCTGVKGGKCTLQAMTHSEPGRVWIDFKDSNQTANLCLDVFNSHYWGSAAVGHWTCTGNLNQRWIMGDGSGSSDPSAMWETIRPVADQSFCLDAEGRRTEEGTRVFLWKCNGQTNQLWARFTSG